MSPPAQRVLLAFLVGFAFAHSADGAAAASCQAGTAACGREADDEQSLLAIQHRGKTTHLARDAGSGSKAKRALTFCGGGWKAQTVQLGMLTGFLAHIGSETHTKATLLDSGLLENFSVYSSNSGGTWTASSLLYGAKYLEMLEAMGAEPDKAGEIFDVSYADKLMGKASTFGKCNTKVGLMSTMLGAAGESETGDLFEAMKVCHKPGTPITWDGFTQQLLERTAGIEEGRTIGGAVNAFAKGKIWLAGGSLPLPGSNLSWDPFPQGKSYFEQAKSLWGKSGDKAVYYVAQRPDSAEFPSYLPTHFSIELGAGEDSAAPSDFCGDSECYGLSYAYTSVKGSKAKNATSPKLADGYKTTFGKEAGRLPLHGVVAVSSSTTGGAVVSPAMSMLYSSCVDMTVFADAAAHSKGFNVPQGGGMSGAYTQDGLGKLAASLRQPIVDGGYTENTAVAWAVAQGATELVSFFQWYDLVNLFSPSNTVYGKAQSNIQVHFQVFAETKEDVEGQFLGNDTATGKGFTQLEVPANQTKFLQTFGFGTIHATTVDSPWFGIKAGIPVTIHAFWPRLNIAAAGKWYDYGTAIDEIAATMLYEPNSALTSQMIDIFRGCGSSGSPCA